MKVFVSGGSGMVGRNFCQAAAGKGWEIDAPNRARLDLLDPAATLDYMVNSRPDMVVHCAGIVGGIQANIAAPYEFCHGNLQIGANVIHSALQGGVKELLNVGSSCMYPRNAENPLREESILSGDLEPTNEGYAIAKIAAARMCDYASSQFEVHYKTLIPCNLYGRFDNFDATSAHLIPAVINKMHYAVANGLDTVEIWGDGTARREFMFAGDLTNFMCFVIENFSRLEAYTNVGLGQDYSVNDYYAAVADVAGFGGNFSHDLSKPAGMQQKLVNTRKQMKLGWRPETSLEQGIRKTYQYFTQEVVSD